MKVMEENVQGLKQRQEDMAMVLPTRFLSSTKHASIQILNEDRNYVGIGFFVRPKVVFTAEYVLTQNYNVGTTTYYGKVQNSEGVEIITFTMKGYYTDYDFAVLTTLEYESKYCLPIKNLDGIGFGSKKLVMTTFNSCTDMFDSGFGVMPAILLRKGDHHLVYTSNLFSGDSGVALIHSSDGSVLGIHLETVNEAKDHIDKGAYVLEDVAKSVSSLISGLSQGFIGLRLDCDIVTTLLND